MGTGADVTPIALQVIAKQMPSGRDLTRHRDISLLEELRGDRPHHTL